MCFDCGGVREVNVFEDFLLWDGMVFIGVVVGGYVVGSISDR